MSLHCCENFCNHVLSCRTIGTDPYGDPNCVHIASVTTHANQTYMVIVSDEDDFDAVLPVQTVKYISVSDRKPYLLFSVQQGTLPSQRTTSRNCDCA